LFCFERGKWDVKVSAISESQPLAFDRRTKKTGAKNNKETLMQILTKFYGAAKVKSWLVGWMVGLAK